MGRFNSWCRFFKIKSVVAVFIIITYVGSARGEDASRSLLIALNRAKADTARVSILIKLSDSNRSNNPSKAMEFAKKSYALVQKIGSARYTADALVQLAICQTDQFDLSNALRSINSAISICEKVNYKSGLTLALVNKGRILDTKAEFPDAIEQYRRALSIAEKQRDLNGMSLASYGLGQTYTHVDDIKKAYEYITKSIMLDSLINHKVEMAKGYNNLGIIYEQTGDYNKSLEYYTKAYQISLRINNKNDLAKNLSNIGNIYFQTKEYRKALSQHLQSIRIKQEISDIQGIANSYNNIAVTYIELKKMDSSFYYLKEALKIYTRLNDKQSIGRSYGNLGSVYLMAGKDKVALAYIHKGIEIRTSIGDVEGAARGYFTLGEYYNGKNNSLALSSYKRSLEFAKKGGIERLKMECSLKISGIYEKMNSAKLALAFFKDYHSYSDSIFSRKNQQLLLELKAKYETSAKDNEIKNLNSSNEIGRLKLEKSKEELKKQRAIMGVVTVILLLSIGFASVYYRLFRQRQRMNKKLALQNERIALQNAEIIEQRNDLEVLNGELERQKVLVTNQRDAIEMELKQTLLASEILQRQNIQYKFDVLKNQLNPHFLFNTFSTLISLIPEDAALAEKYTRKLSSVYRYILSGKDKELVTLEKEIEFVNAYMFLVSIRFDDNVKFSIDISEELMGCYLPLLSLQLLIENAVKHNRISKSSPLSITIKSEGEMLVVQNNLQKRSSAEGSTKIGLKNIASRYELIGDAKLEIEQSPDYFTVRLPLIKEHRALEVSFSNF